MVDETNYIYFTGSWFRSPVPDVVYERDEFVPWYFIDAYRSLLHLVPEGEGYDRVDVDYAKLYARMLTDGIETDDERRERLSPDGIDPRIKRDVSGSLDELTQWGEGDYYLYFKKLTDEGDGLIRHPRTPPSSPVEIPYVPVKRKHREQISRRRQKQPGGRRVQRGTKKLE